jgi:hypothetical protein
MLQHLARQGLSLTLHAKSLTLQHPTHEASGSNTSRFSIGILTRQAPTPGASCFSVDQPV